MTTPEIPPEIEAKFIDINIDLFRQKLQEIGAKLISPERLMRRTNFDISEHEFTRVRDEGDKVTISYKNGANISLSGMREICVEVDNYDNAVALLIASGLKPKAIQETRRETWRLGDAEIDIDTWPWLPSFVEIEASTEDEVRFTAEKLGFNMENAFFGSAAQIYEHYYNVTPHEINFYPEITFGPVPDWLEQKRK